MQSIVADTTPLNYLILIQAAEILPNLYRTVLIPPAVKAELAHANTPAIVRAWISQPPQWLEVVSLKQPVDSALAHLDAGEREAISRKSNSSGPFLEKFRNRSVRFDGTRVGRSIPSVGNPPADLLSGIDAGTIREQ